jgi:hypothetical protein
MLVLPSDVTTNQPACERPMKTIEVYDPPMCCATGVCGTGIDPDVVNLSTMLLRIGRHGIAVQRFNLGQQPQAFADNALVKQLLETEGKAALPLIIIDGKVHVQGRYPTAAERTAMEREALGSAAEVLA